MPTSGFLLIEVDPQARGKEAIMIQGKFQGTLLKVSKIVYFAFILFGGLDPMKISVALISLTSFVMLSFSACIQRSEGPAEKMGRGVDVFMSGVEDMRAKDRAAKAEEEKDQARTTYNRNNDTDRTDTRYEDPSDYYRHPAPEGRY